MLHRGCTLWFTGLPGSGKSTLARALQHHFRSKGCRVELLDGDVVRTHLSKGLGFSKEDRDIHILRIGYVARLLSRNGVIAIAAAISPYKAIREENRRLIESDGVPFVEIYTSCPLEVLIQRDPKGLYRRALAGEIPFFTGISDPYEPPENPEVVVHTDRETVEESLGKILDDLCRRGILDGSLRWPTP